LSDTANAATEVVAEVAEEVAEHATALAQTSRGFSGHDAGLVFGSLVVGAGVGGALCYIFVRRQLETKYSKIAAEEVAQMREHYAAKAVALESQNGKGDLQALVEEKGYVSPEPTDRPPMSVEPPSAVVEAAAESAEAGEVEPDEVVETETRNVFDDTELVDEWDAHKERASRSPQSPYVIHREERDDDAAYDEVTYTYYEGDDVLCNERDEIISQEDRDRLIGEANLEKFGHGSGDPYVVYIRNDKLEIDCEIVKSTKSYAEEVRGITDQDLSHSSMSRRKGRVSPDDE
jgi:hypothetical protein